MIETTLTDLIVLSFAAFALSNLLVNEQGPRGALGRFRIWIQPRTEVLLCIRCASFWVILGILWVSQQHVDGWSLNGINQMLAIWGGVILIDKVANS
jgi:hypothetical protein